MITPLSPSPPIRQRKRREQMEALRELRPGSVKLKRIRVLKPLVKIVLSIGVMLCIFPILTERIGFAACLFIVIAIMTLMDELFWRFVMVPIMDRELERSTPTRQDAHEAHP